MTYPELHLYIDGRWRAASDGATLPVFNPASGEVLGQVPVATPQDVDEALAATQRGHALWRKTSAFDRANLMHRAAALVRERLDAIATVLTLEQGKPLAEARAEVASGADWIDWAAEEGRRLYGRIIPSREPGVRQMVLVEPVGPSAGLAPWNFPCTATSRKIVGALAAGCSVIIKPSEETPATCMALVRAFHDAGLPAGVIGLLCGEPDAIARRLIASPVIRKVSFTGSIPVGKHLARLAADGLKVLTMELGGHAPVIVCDDADLDRAVDLLVRYKYRNAGQVCVGATRFYVQEGVYAEFCRRFTEQAAALRVDHGLADGVQMGPMANERRLAAMEHMVSDARAHGARVATGGHRLERAGWFYAPTVLTDVPETALIMNDEPFGPLAPITPFATVDEALQRANRLPYGLASYAFTRSLARAHQIAEGLEAGMVAINSTTVNLPETPFGGVKESGYGKEAGSEGVGAYTVRKYVHEASL